MIKINCIDITNNFYLSDVWHMDRLRQMYAIIENKKKTITCI